MPESIFISYRRATSGGSAGRLYDTLAAHFGEEHVFLDVDSIEPGEEFAAVLSETLSLCRAVLVVIDPAWLGVATSSGSRRLEDPSDFVRIEVEQSLAAGVMVFPVLVGGAPMPESGSLPASMRALAGKQAVDISPSRYSYDVGRLIAALEATVGRPSRRRWSAVRAGWKLPRRTGWRPLAAVGAALVLGIVVVIVFSQRAGPSAWDPLPDAPVALEGAGVAAHQGQLWVVGGVSGLSDRDLLGSVHVYDPETATWSPGPPLPEPVAFASLVSTGETLFLVGGQASRGAIRSTLRLDEGAADWAVDVPLPAGREAGAAAWDGSRIVYAGGVGTDHAATDSIFALVKGRWTEIGRLSTPREKAAAVSDGFGTVWIIGGRDRHAAVPAFGDVDIVQVDRTARGQAVEPVHSAAAAWVPGSGPCAIGGDTGSGVSAAVQCLDGPSALPALPGPRAGLGAAVVGRDVYVMGGYGEGQHGSADLHVFHTGD